MSAFNRQAICIGLLSAASLLLESTLTRLLAVTQFYHFAFLVVSLALLGYGASGTLLSVSPRLRNMPLDGLLLAGCGGYVLSVGFAFGIVNLLPFDSYAVAWDRRQLLFFGIYYLTLSIPFLMSGIVAGAGLHSSKERRHIVYASNLLGSGIGVLIAPIGLELSGVPGSFLLSGLLGMAAMMPIMNHKAQRTTLKRGFKGLAILVTITGLCCWGLLIWINLSNKSPLILKLSEHKDFAQALRVRTTEVVFSRWNAISRVDIVQGAGTHYFPGLSYAYTGEIPEQIGISIDAGPLQPVTLVSPENFHTGEYLPESIVFKLRPDGRVMIIEPGGGLSLLQALSQGSRTVTAVVSNPLVVDAIQDTAGPYNIYSNTYVQTEFEAGRVFLKGGDKKYEIIILPLTDGYRPIANGAYSLAEENLITIEGMVSLLENLSPNGVMVISRWLQTPPSESLKLIATIVEALSGSTKDISGKIVLFRGIQTMTVLVNPSGWITDELIMIRSFLHERKFDLVWAPDIKSWEPNQFNQIPEAWYYKAVQEMLTTTNRPGWYLSNTFDIRPPTDDHPFFYHFFKWEQIPDVLASMGHVWQPFGGSGYLVTLALLGLTVIVSVLLILLPLVRLRKFGSQIQNISQYWVFFLYFSLLGFGFLFIEIPLIQHSILLFSHPITAFSVVVFTLLTASSLGSVVAGKKSKIGWVIMLGLAIITGILALTFPKFVALCLEFSLLERIGWVVLALAPIGFFMGFPFPLGLALIEESASDLIPWVWGINGSISVVASVMAAILILSLGFTDVLWLGAIMYSGATLVYVKILTGNDLMFTR